MAKSTKKNIVLPYGEPPETLEDHPFYGLNLDDEQKKFRDSIWDNDTLIVYCNACSGCGKTTIATATANLLCQYGRYDGIVYIAAPVQEHTQGYIPGSIEQKSDPYFLPFYQALEKIGVSTKTSMYDNIINEKNGTAYIECMTHTYMRGTNFENKVIIIDEAQNFYTDELKKVLTRIHDSCKVIVIGHSGQCDLYYNSERSGFVRYLNHYRSAGDSRVAVCQLTKNYRGWISTWADELDSCSKTD